MIFFCRKNIKKIFCEHSPLEIAEILQKNIKGVETDLSATIYRYVKALLEKGNTKIGSWRDICEWLECSGYKCEIETEFNDNNFSDKNLFNVTNVKFENNEIKIDVFLQITIPVPTDLFVQGLDNINFN